MPSFSFPREARVRKRGAFVEIQRDGRKLAAAALLLFVHAQRRPHRARLGVTVSRRVGSAVERNAIKRRLREIFRLHPAWFRPGRDYVFVARPAASGKDYAGLRDEVERLCQRDARARPETGDVR